MLLAKADAAKGAAIFKKCQACHDGTKGGPNKVGPNLWGVVDRPIASHEGFSYSAGMKEFSKGGAEKWTYENLFRFLLSPKADVKGTAMGFAGLKKEDERADLLAYLQTLVRQPGSVPASGIRHVFQMKTVLGNEPSLAILPAPCRDLLAS